MKHNTDAELLPCPFCGGRAEAKKPDVDYEFTFIRCKECCAQSDEGVDFEDAAESWNRRTTASKTQRVPMLFNPFNGKPRHPLDVQSDPYGLLITAPNTELRAVPVTQENKPLITKKP